MPYLLDTNVVSEWVRPVPDPGVVRWLAEVDARSTYLSVMTLAEVRYGIERLVDGDRRRRLSLWLERDLPGRFRGRILDIDRAMADAWGHLETRTRAAGKTMEVIDGLLAATAAVRGLTMVTRNVADFAAAGIELLNPWTSHT